MSADNVRGWEIVRKMSFEGKYEILRTISQPRTLSANTPASQKGVYLFYNPPINFHIVPTARKKTVLIWQQMGAIVESELISTAELYVLDQNLAGCDVN